MGIVFRSMLKNIGSKLGRSVILIFCIMITAFVGLFAFDMNTNVNTLMMSYLTESLGNIDLMVESTNQNIFDGVEGIDELGISIAMYNEITRDAELYNYSFTDAISVVSYSDYEKAVSMSFMDSVPTFNGPDEIYASEGYLETYGKSIGDTLVITSSDNIPYVYTIVGSVGVPKSSTLGYICLFGNSEAISRLNAYGEVKYSEYFVQIHEGADRDAIKGKIMENDAFAEITDFIDDLEDSDLDSITNLFLLMFLFTFLLVIFVTISFSEKIVNERMSVIGTLRSLGVSRFKTSCILILENVLYGVIGSIIGCILYKLARNPFFSSFFLLEDSNGNFLDVATLLKPTPIITYILVILGAILVEALCPLFELTKAVKTPIRDIIFITKDTAYKYSWKRAYLGGILIVISIVTAFVTKSFAGVAISIVSTIVALAVLIPYVLKGVSLLSDKFIAPGKMPIAKLALKEVSNNKHLVGTSVLCVTTIVLSTCLYAFANNFIEDVMDSRYDCDVIVMYTPKEDYYYNFINEIDGVTGVEPFYSYSSEGKIGNSDERTLCVVKDYDYEMEVTYSSLDGTLQENEVILSEVFLRTNNYSIGDEIEICFNSDMWFPITKTFTIADSIDSSIGTVIVNSDVYEHLFDNEISEISISTEDGKADEISAQLRKYLPESADMINTLDYLNERDSEQSSSLIAGIVALVIAAMILTIIGCVGNQTIGFENRKREFAVLYSTSMSRSKLVKLIFLETVFSIGTAGILAFIMSPFLISRFAQAMVIITFGDLRMVQPNLLSIFIYVLLVFAILLLTTISPIKRIKKMQPAMELKYE